jgi:hypothetical protein
MLMKMGMKRNNYPVFCHYGFRVAFYRVKRSVKLAKFFLFFRGTM